MRNCKTAPLTQLGIPISGLAIHPVVNMVSFWLSFEVSHIPAEQVPAEARHGMAVPTTSLFVYKATAFLQVEREQAIQSLFL
jgi:hypothetical protein